MAEPMDLAVKERKELELRRAQMARNPFCPDHRDKVYGKPCRECEIEHLARIVRQQRAALRMALGSGGLNHVTDTKVRNVVVAALALTTDEKET